MNGRLADLCCLPEEVAISQTHPLEDSRRKGMLPLSAGTPRLCAPMAPVAGQLVWLGAFVAVNVLCSHRAADGCKHPPWVRQGE